jgi:trans-aconitate methyltransferase
LHFVSNHHEFMVRLVSFLHEGGRLAVQMPNNIQELSHALMRVLICGRSLSPSRSPSHKTSIRRIPFAMFL